MKQETIPNSSWRMNLLITGGVLFTVLLALILAQIDGLQRQILPSPIAIAITNLNATPTSTPLPAIPLSSGTPLPPGAVPAEVSNGILRTCATTPPDWVRTAISSEDTLLSLSVRYNISAEKIRLANCLEGDSLLELNTIYLPNPATTPTVTPICSRPPSTWVLTNVLPGQTMYRLAQIYNTTVNTILRANCFTSTDLQAGQPIYLPGPNIMPPNPTATATPTSTATATATATSTSTGTPTNTPTSTAPPLPTVSATPTSTVTSTPTGTSTASPTASVTPTVSNTPAATSSPTASATPTASPTASATPTPTATLSPTPSITPTPSATPSNTPLPTNTATPTNTPTNTPSPIP